MSERWFQQILGVALAFAAICAGAALRWSELVPRAERPGVFRAETADQRAEDDARTEDDVAGARTAAAVFIFFRITSPDAPND